MRGVQQVQATPLLTGEAADIGTATFATTANVDDTISFTLTAAKIQEMITGGVFTNNGFILKVDTESSDRYQFIGSGGTAAKRPKLVIDYTAPIVEQKNRSYAYFM